MLITDTRESSAEPSDILQELQRFFQSLYQPNHSPDASAFLDTLWGLSLLSFSEDEGAVCLR